MVEAAEIWGTWEELVLGGAVLRHGTADWDAVASEVRSRTNHPSLFTDQECETKYQDIRERYSGCDAWFEELRKHRVAELKRELARSEDSIGSSKLESLKAESGSDGNFNHGSTRTESSTPAQNAEPAEFFSKELSKDGLSAGSLLWKQRMVTLQSKVPKLEPLEETHKDSRGIMGSLIGQGSLRKRRGQRKRRAAIEIKEGKMAEREMLDSENDVVERKEKVDSRGKSNEDSKPQRENLSSNKCKETAKLSLRGILDMVMEHKSASTFHRKLESQKRARYKKMIRHHIDLKTLRFKVEEGSITSTKELHRDLLLLCNNAIAFYQKGSPEYASSLSLRKLLVKIFPESPIQHGDERKGKAHKLLKPQGIHPCNRKDVRNPVVLPKPHTHRQNSKTSSDSPMKRGVGRPPKNGRGGVGRRRQDISSRGSKRTRIS
ncbi:hypothetical protein QJS10_CPA01g02333 [Acorus calamus]|uniref:Bromo domain-containing protein n=1 Tax=Acorus calamus TaxID=4465 RepID=A0AAV9FJS4_ACOCL|nr:hypothetical protein QJS10_CPA01g02333 [Acorus calamus]